jgi:hypothetical protein
MVVVRNEDDVDPADVGGGDRGAHQLREHDRRPGASVFPRRIERRVGQDAKAAVVDEGGRAAHELERRGARRGGHAVRATSLTA